MKCNSSRNLIPEVFTYSSSKKLVLRRFRQVVSVRCSAGYATHPAVQGYSSSGGKDGQRTVSWPAVPLYTAQLLAMATDGRPVKQPPRAVSSPCTRPSSSPSCQNIFTAFAAAARDPRVGGAARDRRVGLKIGRAATAVRRMTGSWHAASIAQQRS